MAAMQARRPMPVFLGIMFVAYLVLAFAIAFLLTGIPTNAVTGRGRRSSGWARRPRSA